MQGCHKGRKKRALVKARRRAPTPGERTEEERGGQRTMVGMVNCVFHCGCH